MSTVKDALIIDQGRTIAQLRHELSQAKMHIENIRQPLGARTATVLDCAAFISIKQHANGAVSITGNVGDEKLALSLIDNARDAIKNQHKNRSSLVASDGNPLVIPNRDAALAESKFPIKPLGDMNPAERGDLPL